MGTSGGQVPGVRVGRELAENQVRGHKQGHRWKAMNSNHHKGPCPGAWGRGALRLQRPGHALQMPSFVGKQAWHQGAWKLSLQATQGGSCVTITEVPRGTVAGHKGKVRASTRSAGKELSAKGIRHPGVGGGGKGRRQSLGVWKNLELSVGGPHEEVLVWGRAGGTHPHPTCRSNQSRGWECRAKN